MIAKMLDAIGAEFPLTETDAGEFAALKVSGMKFRIRAFRAEGLGHVSVMEASGFFGLMKMDTLIICPTCKDMPLLSYDRVNAMGNDTLIYELYDTLLGEADLSGLEAVKAEAAALPDHDLGAHWYDDIKLSVSLSKKGKRLHSKAFDVCATNYLRAFLGAAKKAAPCEASPKREKASVYVEGLLRHGGPSTDVFKKGIGEEKTAALFRTVLFGTQK
jgi:hypothetical protein